MIPYKVEILSKVLDQAPCHFYALDKNGKVLSCNDQQAISLGYGSSAEIIGKTLAQLLPLSDTGNWMQTAHRIMQTNQPECIEELASFLGGPRYFLSYKMPLLNKNKDPVGIVGISIDITEHKQKTEMKLATQASMLQLTEMLSSSIAHDFKNPIASMQLGLESIKRQINQALANLQPDSHSAPDVATEKLHRAKKSIDKLSSTILDYNNLIERYLHDIKKRHIDPSSFKKLDIATCIERSLDDYPFQPGQKNWVTLTVEKNFVFEGDAAHTNNLWFNLIKNALFFIKQEQRGKITIRATIEDNKGIVYFCDTAKGMNEDEVEKAFKNFYSNRTQGTGIGLSYCQLIMEAYGGSISCQAVLGEYTEFRLVFPLAREL